MPRIFYNLEQAAEALAVTVAEVEDMLDLRELALVQVGSRRLVHVRDIERISSRVERGGPLRVRRAYTANMVPEALNRAADELGVRKEDLVYDVLENAQLRMPGVEGRPARITVQLPDGLASFPEKTDPKPHEPAQTPSDERPDATPAAGEAPHPRPHPQQDTSPPENIGVFYAPEQVARLLGRRIEEVNLWIYRRQIPTLNINDYLWVPEEAVTELVKREPPLGTGSPPKPFRLVIPTEDTKTSSFISRLGGGEVAESDVRDALRRRITELEGLVESLREEILRNAPTLRDEFFANDVPSENGHENPRPLANA